MYGHGQQASMQRTQRAASIQKVDTAEFDRWLDDKGITYQPSISGGCWRSPV